VAIIGTLRTARGALQRAPAFEIRREIVLCGPASLLPVELEQLARACA